MQSEQLRLRTVAGELRVLVASLSKPRMAGQRLTRQRAEVATLLAPYREVLLILGRIETGLRKLERLQRDMGKIQTISAILNGPQTTRLLSSLTSSERGPEPPVTMDPFLGP